MRTDRLPEDARRVLGAYNRAVMEKTQADILARELDRSPEAVMPVAGAPAGDERDLRGIPAIGRNVAGAIAGTRPDGIAA